MTYKENTANGDVELMRLVFHTGALARRKKHCSSDNAEGQNASSPPPKRGYGHILCVLSANDGITQRELAEILKIRPQSLSQAISKFIDDGLVEKRQFQGDRRKVLLFLTDCGRERLNEIQNTRVKHAEAFFSPLTESEKALLFSLLSKLAQSNT